jgi:putative transferase (TIGR04331 family)
MHRPLHRTLVCTADTRTWPPQGHPVLYLGEWCRTHALRADWKQRDHEVLPYHWRDVQERHADYRRLNALFEQILPQLAAVLDSIHGVRHSVRYWRVVAGSWLRHFIGVIYDRYRALQAAFASGRIDCMPALRCGAWQRVPRNISDFLHEVSTDGGNQHLFGALGAIMAPELVRIVGCEDFSRPEQGGNMREWGSIAAFMASRGLSSLSRRRLVASLAYCKASEIANLGLQLRGLPLFPIPRFRPRTFAIDPSLRGRLALGLASGPLADPFLRVLDAMLKECLPSAYLEGHASLFRLAGRVFPKSVDAIVDDNALHVNDVYKIWAASAVEQGARLAICQHGGFYGSGEWNDDEMHEKAISDVFLNWGWEQTSSSAPFPSPVLSRLLARPRVFKKTQRRVAWIANMFPRYAGSQRSMPVSSEVLGYIEDQIAFFRCLPPALRSQLWLRPYHKDWDWGFVARLQEAGFDADNICSREKMSLTAQLGQSRVGIYTANTTVHLEMFAMNIPTLLYWDRAIWRNRPEAEPYYEVLRAARVLHDSPESAAATLAAIYDDPWTWWSSPVVKGAVQRYLERFGLASAQWAREWKTRLATTGLLQE